MDLILPVEDNKIWQPGRRKIMGLKYFPFEYKEMLIKYFAQYMAEVYAVELKLAIENQRYQRFWKSLTKKYLAHKKRMGWSTKIWEAIELLKNTIDFWRSTSPRGFVVGVRPGIFYETETGKKLEVRMVAFWMEYGTGIQAEGGDGRPDWPGMPSRPLFRPLRQRLSKDISMHYKNFIKDYAEEIDELLAGTILGFRDYNPGFK